MWGIKEKTTLVTLSVSWGTKTKPKNEIKNAFQIIRIRLNEKEKEIIEKTETTLKDNLNELKYFQEHHLIYL